MRRYVSARCSRSIRPPVGRTQNLRPSHSAAPSQWTEEDKRPYPRHPILILPPDYFERRKKRKPRNQGESPSTLSVQPALSNHGAYDTHASSLLAKLVASPPHPIEAFEHALAELPRDTPYTPQSLLDGLKCWPSSPGTTVHLASLLQCSLKVIPIADSITLLRSLMPSLSRHRMNVALSPIVSTFLLRMDQAIADNEVDKDMTQLYYLRFIISLGSFGWGDTVDHPTGRPDRPMEPLPALVRSETARLVERMISDFDRFPSASRKDSPGRLDSWLLTRLLTARYMSPRLMEVLVPFAKRIGWKFTPKHLHLAFVSAAQEGQTGKANEYLLMREEEEGRRMESDRGQKGQSQDRQVGTADGEGLERDETDRPHSTNPTAAVTLNEQAQQSARARNSVSRARITPDFDKFTELLEPLLEDDTGQLGSETDQSDSTNGSRADRHINWQNAPDGQNATYEQIQTLRYSWSVLLARTAEHPAADASHLLDLFHAMPDLALCGHTMTPVMKALLERGNLDAAWDIWRWAVSREKYTSNPERYIDKVTLAVGSEILGRRRGLSAAVWLVDSYAQRPGAKHRSSEREIGQVNRLPIDAQNVAILIREAASARSPTTAFRLWTAAQPRWGVWPNEVCLGLIINAARLCEYGSKNNPDEHVDDDATRWKILMNGLHPLRPLQPAIPPGEDPMFRAYEADGFSKGNHQVLLDPPGYKWFHTYGISRPWQRARYIFREVVLHNWPHLRDVNSPLDVRGNTFLGLGYRLNWTKGARKDATSAQAKARTRTTDLPSPKARYMHIIPTAGTWHTYVRLLGTFNRIDEVTLALAWMRELGTRPERETLIAALAYVKEVQGPRRIVKNWKEDGGSALVLDEDILRRWLEDWLGEGVEKVQMDGQWVEWPSVPSDDEVWKFRFEVAKSRKKLIL